MQNATQRYGIDQDYNLGLKELTTRENVANIEASARRSGGFMSMLGQLGAEAIRRSDRRLKKDIKKVGEIKVPIYTWKYNGKGGTRKGEPGIGVMAQDLEKIPTLSGAVKYVKTPDLGRTRLVDYAMLDHLVSGEE
jgi:hypothetical protein